MAFPNPFSPQRPSLWPGGFLSPGAIPIVFDACLSEQHGEQYGVASSPIEGGAVISDHVQRQPITFTTDVVFTDNPDDFVTLALKDRFKDQYAQILAVADTRVPFDYLSSMRPYTSMVFTAISAPRTVEQGRSIVITLSMRKIELATVDQAAVLADAAIAIALGKQNLGNMGPEVTAALDGLAAPPVV